MVSLWQSVEMWITVYYPLYRKYNSQAIKMNNKIPSEYFLFERAREMESNVVREILLCKWSWKSGFAQSAKHDVNKTVLHLLPLPLLRGIRAYAFF